MERDIVIIVEGGVMLGVFGAGVLTPLQEANIYSRVHSIYAVSAGAHDAAYFLAKDLPKGSSIYYEDFSGANFIKKHLLWRFIYELLAHPFKKGRRINLVDIDFAISVELSKKILNLALIQQQGIPFLARVYDIENNEHTYLDCANNTFEVLRATSAVIPYYHSANKINGKSYIDGGVIGTRNFIDIIEKHPDKKILYIRNKRQNNVDIIRELPGTFIEGFLIIFSDGISLAYRRLKNIFKRPTIKELEAYPNVILAQNTKPSSSIITEPKKVKQIHKSGLEEGKRILKLLE
jgi:predicted patatin/cPLA2 family phospholipase